MVAAGDVDGHVQEAGRERVPPRDLAERVGADGGVRLHHEPLVGVERAGLVQDVVRQRGLADVVERRAVFQRADEVLVEERGERRRRGGLLRQHAAIPLEPQQVRAGLGRAVLDQLGQRQHQPVAGADQFAVAVLERSVPVRR